MSLIMRNNIPRQQCVEIDEYAEIVFTAVIDSGGTEDDAIDATDLVTKTRLIKAYLEAKAQ